MIFIIVDNYVNEEKQKKHLSPKYSNNNQPNICFTTGSLGKSSSSVRGNANKKPSK